MFNIYIQFTRLLFFIFISLTAFVTITFSTDLRDTTHQADYIIIAPSSYFSIAESLAEFRSTKNGFAVSVIPFDTILAQFEVGLSPDTSLKSFIQYSLDYWSDPKPQYFVLVGNINTIPSHIEKETIHETNIPHPDTLMMDQWFVESLPDSNHSRKVWAIIGRLPGWDSLGVSTIVNKTMYYETDTASNWNARAVCLSDYTNDDGLIFEYDARHIQDIFGSLWHDTIAVHVRFDSPYYVDSMGYRNFWDEGAAIMTYTGHANAVTLSARSYLTTWSVESLKNGMRLPVCLFGGCNLMFDTKPPVSLPINLLQKIDGGAVAIVASEGLMYEGVATAYISEMAKSMTKNPKEPIGKAFLKAKLSSWDNVARRITFLGDPALTVKSPAVPSSVYRPVLAAEEFVLKQNFPNPFNPTTTIQFSLPVRSDIRLYMVNTLGQIVKEIINENYDAGNHQVIVNASSLASGVYFYRLETSTGFIQTKKLVLLK